MIISRGEIYRVDLDPTRGSEMKKARPAVVVSNDAINRNAAVVIVCPITDAGEKFSPVHVKIPRGEGGLAKDSVAHCGQIRAVDKERLISKMGELDPRRMETITAGLKNALDLTL